MRWVSCFLSPNTPRTFSFGRFSSLNRKGLAWEPLPVSWFLGFFWTCSCSCSGVLMPNASLAHCWSALWRSIRRGIFLQISLSCFTSHRYSRTVVAIKRSERLIVHSIQMGKSDVCSEDSVKLTPIKAGCRFMIWIQPSTLIDTCQLSSYWVRSNCSCRGSKSKSLASLNKCKIALAGTLMRYQTTLERRLSFAIGELLEL